MNTRLRLPLCLLLASGLVTSGLITGAAGADVLIESTAADGATSRVLITGDRARIDTGRQGYWLLLDLAAGTILAVDESEKLAMDMRSPMPRRPEHGDMVLEVEPPRIRFEDRRDGPEIAGFRTVHYRVMVDDTHCYDEYLAPDALDDDGIRRFVALMAAGSNNDAQRTLIQLTDPSRLCEAADDLIDDHYPQAGIPLRTLDADGRRIHEITRIAFDVGHDAALFRLPDGYPVLSRVEVMERAVSEPFDADALRERLQEIDRRMQEFEQH